MNKIAYRTGLHSYSIFTNIHCSRFDTNLRGSQVWVSERLYVCWYIYLYCIIVLFCSNQDSCNNKMVGIKITNRAHLAFKALNDQNVLFSHQKRKRMWPFMVLRPPFQKLMHICLCNYYCKNRWKIACKIEIEKSEVTFWKCALDHNCVLLRTTGISDNKP